MNQSAKVSNRQYETDVRLILTGNLGKSCPKLVLTNGQLACTGNLFEDNCKFECNEGFTLKGEDRASCTVKLHTFAPGNWPVFGVRGTLTFNNGIK